MGFFQSVGIVALFNDIFISVARKGVTGSPSNFGISPGTQTGPTDLFIRNFC